MDQRRFHNALRILHNIDERGIPGLSDAQRTAFARNPFDFYIRAGDEIEDKLWALIEARQPKKEAALPEAKDDDDYHRPDSSGYSRADEEWFFDMDGKP